MVQIVGLVIAGIDAEPLAAEHIVRAKQFRRCRIFDHGADLLARELGGRVVGRLVEQQVAEGAEEGQPAAPPGLLILATALFRRRVEGWAGVVGGNRSRSDANGPWRESPDSRP